MRYTRSFFALQLAFAQRVAAHFSLPLADALRHYTTFAVSLHAEETWESYARSFEQAPDPLELTYRLYLERSGDEREPHPDDTTFKGHPLFGCFYYAVQGESMIRTHYINNDEPGMRPLSRDRASARREELRRMFTHIREAVPGATTVMGHSWLYNLPAYTRLFPPSYTAQVEVNPDGVLQQMVLWFQCYDRFWEIKPDIAAELLWRVEQLSSPADLRLCFPYQRLRTRASIDDFYAFYGISADSRIAPERREMAGES